MRSAARTRTLELLRRGVVLLSILAVLAVGLVAFAARQSLVVTARPYLLTRVWVPSALLRVSTPARTSGDAVGVPVLVYHGIQPSGSTCNVTPETFIAHMAALKRAGYATLSMDEFLAFMAEGRAVPEKSVLITFDDGRTDSFSGADPVLRRLGFHASMFTILGRTHSSKSFYLTAAETKMMARSGRWDVQSHTANSHEFVRASQMGAAGHALTTRAWLARERRLESDAEWAARVRGDLARAKTGLSELTGRPVVALAYPWGDTGRDASDPLVRAELRGIAESGYAITFRQAGATIDESYNYPSDFGATLRRIYVTYDMTAEELMRRISRGIPKPLPFAETHSFESDAWVLSSGAFQPRESGGRALVPPPAAGQARAEAFLDGSRAWADYSVSGQLRLAGSETVSVVVRRAGPRDYLAVTISRTYVSVQQVFEDRVSTLAEADVSLAARTPLSMVVRAEGDSVSLALEGRQVLLAERILDAPRAGGIGFRIETDGGSRATLALDELEVTGAWAPSPGGAGQAVAVAE